MLSSHCEVPMAMGKTLGADCREGSMGWRDGSSYFALLKHCHCFPNHRSTSYLLYGTST